MRAAERELEVSFRLRRSLHLLAFLALSPGRRAARQEVAEALWPEASEESARRNFHPVVSVARRSLREAGAGEHDFVVAAGGAYALDERIRWIADVDERREKLQQADGLLERGDRRGAAAAWQAAWRLYRGPLLQGVDLPWVVPAREALREEHLAQMRRFAETLLALGRSASALDVYRALLVEDPLQESDHLALMGVYARQGRRDLVRRQYERLCALLRAELGSEPLLRTTLEYHTLMA